MSENPHGQLKAPSSVRARRAAVTSAAVLAAWGAGLGGVAAASAASEAANVTKAKEAVAKLTGVPKWVAPGPSVDAAKAKGKSIYEITESDGIPTCQQQETDMGKISKSLGISYKTFPNQGSPSQWVAGMDQAINLKPNLIILNCGVNPAELQPQLQAAKKAGIKVLVSFDYADGTKPPPNVTAVSNVPAYALVTPLVDAAIANTGGKVHALIYYPAEITSAQKTVDAMGAEFKRLCPTTCTYKYVNAPIANWATTLQGQVQSDLLSNPGTNYVIPIYDGMEQWVLPGIAAAGKSSTVKSLSQDASPFAMKALQAHNIMVGETALNNNWLAYSTMDQALRLLTGEKPLTAYDTESLLPGMRYFDTANAKAVGVPPSPTQATGWGTSYITGYKKLWGLG